MLVLTTSFPSFGRGFDFHRPLHNLRRRFVYREFSEAREKTFEQSERNNTDLHERRIRQQRFVARGGKIATGDKST